MSADSYLLATAERVRWLESVPLKQPIQTGWAHN
jgi:hypothetical protein